MRGKGEERNYFRMKGQGRNVRGMKGGGKREKRMEDEELRGENSGGMKERQG